jgi:hypothetical protein
MHRNNAAEWVMLAALAPIILVNKLIRRMLGF